VDLVQFCQKRGYSILEQYSSKKNRVALVADGNTHYVIKDFLSPEGFRAQHERQGLIMAHGTGARCPSVRGIHYHRILVLEHLPGENLADQPPQTWARMGPLLGEWFARLHAMVPASGTGVLLRGDCTLRNFLLLSDSSMAGVDFEEWTWGNPTRDIAETVASALTMQPSFTDEAIAMARSLYREYVRYRRDPGALHLQREVYEALERIAARRPAHTDTIRAGTHALMAKHLPFLR